MCEFPSQILIPTQRRSHGTPPCLLPNLPKGQPKRHSRRFSKDPAMTNQNEKLLEWAGFYRRKIEFPGFCAYSKEGKVPYEGDVWVYPDGSLELDHIMSEKTPPDFRDLNCCFEWLEPPLYERFGIYHIGFARVKGVGYNCYMNRVAVEYPHREEGRSKELMTLGHGKTLGEAFCDATLKVIDRYSELEKGIIEQLREKMPR